MCMCIEFVIQVQRQKNAHVFLPVGMVVNDIIQKLDGEFLLMLCWEILRDIWREFCEFYRTHTINA